MSISLNNIESRVTALEKAGSVIVAQHRNGNNWYVKYNNGLILQAGFISFAGQTNTTKTVPLNLKFTTSGYVAISQSDFVNETKSASWGICNVISRTTSDFTIKKAFNETTTVHWIAIGYLVPNRIKCLFKGVISYVNLLK